MMKAQISSVLVGLILTGTASAQVSQTCLSSNRLNAGLAPAISELRPVPKSWVDERATLGTTRQMWAFEFTMSDWPGGHIVKLEPNGTATTSCGKTLAWDFIWGHRGSGVIGIKNARIVDSPPHTEAQDVIKTNILGSIPGYKKVAETAGGAWSFGLYNSSSGPTRSIIAVTPEASYETREKHFDRSKVVRPTIIARFQSRLDDLTAVPGVHGDGAGLTLIGGPDAAGKIRYLEVGWSAPASTQ